MISVPVRYAITPVPATQDSSSDPVGVYSSTMVIFVIVLHFCELLYHEYPLASTGSTLQVTLHVAFAGARWFVPSATLTVMVAVPPPFFVTVTVVPDTVAVAIEELLVVTEIFPFPARVTVKVVVV